MDDSIANTAAPINNNVLRSKQVAPLPIGPGGKNQIKNQMNETNTQLTMLTSQAIANTKYDPPVPKPITKQVTIEKFCSDSSSTASIIAVIGGLFIVYGIVAK
jgi:hypothetical protein